MKLKILAILIILTMVGSTFVASADVKYNDDSENIVVANNYMETKEVKIAILCEEPIGWGSAKFVFIYLLDNYRWTVGNRSYEFDITEIYDEDILKGRLTINNFDALLVPGGGVGDAESLVKGFRHLPKVKKWKNQIVNFIKEGGGYTGYCGGASLMAQLDRKPESLIEWQFDRGSLGASCVKMFLPNTTADRFKLLRESTMAYLWFHNDDKPDYNEVEDMLSFRSGVPVDIPISKDHPIFDDFSENTTRVSWVGGPALIPPVNPDREVHILARYPEKGISDNESTSINAWRYTGGIRGLIKGLIKSISMNRRSNDFEASAYFMAGDWEYTNRKIELNLSNKPCMTAEIYPNNNKGRIVLSGPHPEYPVWWGGHIEPMPDTDKNCLYEGFFKWTNITPFDETPENELSHTWWIVRRQAAWVAKVLDNDLPPAHGASQISDIYPYEQPSIFTVEGNAEASIGLTSLSLYYRYSEDNSSWSEWESYGTDTDDSDGWLWEFNSPDGPGYYQFYSIRNVEYKSHIETENIPPGPDAIVHVDED